MKRATRLLPARYWPRLTANRCAMDLALADARVAEAEAEAGGAAHRLAAAGDSAGQGRVTEAEAALKMPAGNIPGSVN